MCKTKKSIIWSSSDEEFKKQVYECVTMADLLRCYGLINKGGNAKTIKRRIHELNLDTTHFLNRSQSSIQARAMSLEKFKSCCLLTQSSYRRSMIKAYILKFKLKDYICNVCNNKGVWQNQKLTLQLEHINGISNDNRLENLCFLCPNCHTQTETYAGKNNKRIKKEKIKRIRNTRKIKRPEKEELLKLVWESPTSTLARNLGVSDTAIKKWCDIYKIAKPPRGYWQRVTYSKSL